MPEGPPNDIDGQIQFFQQRLTAWATSPATIGLTADQVADLQTFVNLAGSSRSAAINARQASKNATATQNANVSAMMNQGTAMIQTIRAFADLSGDPDSVFTTAELDAPSAKGTPRPAPVPATDMSAELLNTGAIRLTWKGTVAFGTVYTIYRRIGEGSFAPIGTSTTKSFTDGTVPAGTAEVDYAAVTQRDGQASDMSEPIIVRFGVAASTASQSSATGGLGLAA